MKDVDGVAARLLDGVSGAGDDPIEVGVVVVARVADEYMSGIDGDLIIGDDKDTSSFVVGGVAGEI